MSIRPVEKIDDLVPIRNVFSSVTNKNKLAFLAKGLIEIIPEINILSTGGTYDYLAKNLSAIEGDLNLTEVSKYTLLPEMEGGLVKSLHHKLFLGYLAETYCPGHQNDLKRENAVPIDLLVVNLYDFNEAVRKAKDSSFNTKSLEIARGNIDVGGPSALRAAAKNYLRVMILPDEDDYEVFLKDLAANKGATTFDMRIRAAEKTFGILSDYDGAIRNFLRSISPSESMKAYKVYNPRKQD
jgi:phosphoribosylaminoimidazolecarboxamide formyltransferase / IMP cyclohydrolase